MVNETYLTGWELLQEGFGLVGYTEFKIRCHIDFNTGELGCNKCLVCTEIFRVCVQCLKIGENGIL